MIISIQDLSKRYGEGEEAVKAISDIDLGVSENEFVSIVGPSGCGKTTLLHTVAGLLEPTTGRVKRGDLDVQAPDFEKSLLGIVFQQPILLEWRTVQKNIMLPIQIMHSNGDLDEDIEYYRNRAHRLIELVGLEGFEDAYPQELSGGMQQRVSICQSLVYDPEILLMDEPFGSLDALTKDQLNEELLKIWRETNKTILFITHDLDEAVFLSDRVLVISSRPGTVLEDMHIELPRPRTNEVRESEAFLEAVTHLNTHFR
jgi:NitT/TauT family transport system ATP-binding protein